MKNELEESWNKYKEKAPHMTALRRDRCNFQAGFNAAFKLFRKTNITSQPSGQGRAAADLHRPPLMNYYEHPEGKD